MSKFEIFLKSKTTWSLVALFIVQGLTAIKPELSGNLATAVQGILALLALYFPASEIKTAAVSGTISGSSIVEPNG